MVPVGRFNGDTVVFCIPFIFSAPTSEVYELSNSDFDENIVEDLAIIFAVLPV